MKLCASINFLFSELAPKDRLAAAADCGFRGVEIQDCTIEDPEVIADAAGTAGLPIVLLNIPLGDLLTGGPGLSGVPGRESQFEDALHSTKRAADILQPLYVNIGAFRADPYARKASLGVYKNNIAKAIDAFSGSSTRLLIEPMNESDFEGVMPNSLEFASSLIEADFVGSLGIQFDTYHAAKRGDDINEAYSHYARHIEHIQVSDYPGRNEPGTGKLAFGQFFRTLEKNTYSGFVGAEYKPSGATTDSLLWIRK
jgi:hydroxypyruvate isomerase